MSEYTVKTACTECRFEVEGAVIMCEKCPKCGNNEFEITALYDIIPSYASPFLLVVEEAK